MSQFVAVVDTATTSSSKESPETRDLQKIGPNKGKGLFYNRDMIYFLFFQLECWLLIGCPLVLGCDVKIGMFSKLAPES